MVVLHSAPLEAGEIFSLVLGKLTEGPSSDSKFNHFKSTYAYMMEIELDLALAKNFKRRLSAILQSGDPYEIKMHSLVIREFERFADWWQRLNAI